MFKQSIDAGLVLLLYCSLCKLDQASGASRSIEAEVTPAKAAFKTAFACLLNAYAAYIPGFLYHGPVRKYLFLSISTIQRQTS